MFRADPPLASGVSTDQSSKVFRCFLYLEKFSSFSEIFLLRKFFFFLLPLHRLVDRLTFTDVSTIFNRSLPKLRLRLQLISPKLSLFFCRCINKLIFYFSPILAAASTLQTAKSFQWLPYLDEFFNFSKFSSFYFLPLAASKVLSTNRADVSAAQTANFCCLIFFSSAK